MPMRRVLLMLVLFVSVLSLCGCGSSHKRKQGDAVKWTVVSGPPHNVSFYADSIPSGAQAQLSANMPNPMSPLTSPLFNNPGESYTVSFKGVPKGTYKYFCTPHQALGMHAQLTVQ